MGKRRFFSETDAGQILKRYSAVTIMGLLREIARCDEARMDWNALMRKTATGIGNAREYQALWRHIAYRKELADYYADDAQPSDDESDLEFELVPSPTVTADTSAEVVRWVKADMQRFGMTGKKKGEMTKSKPRDAGLPTAAGQARISLGLSASAIDTSHKGASVAVSASVRDPSTPSLSSKNVGPVSCATPESPSGTILRSLGQSERKKRKLWSQEEDQELIAAVEKFGEGNWTNILKGAFTHDRTAAQLSQRWALIRKRREIHTTSNRVTSSLISASISDGQGSGSLTPPGDPSPQANIAQNGGNSDINNPVIVASAVGNISVNRAVTPCTAMATFTSSYGSQSQVQVCSSSNASLGGTGVNSAVNSMVATTGSMDSSSLKGSIVRPGGISTRAGTVSGLRQAQATGTTRSASGSSAAVTTMAASQIRSAGGKSSSGAGAGRLIAPGAVVMSAAAAQAASVGGSEMWQATTLPPAGVMTSAGPAKYIRSNAVSGTRSMSAKPITGPDPGVQAAAVAAGARIAPASAAASLLKAAQSGNVVHIGPGGAPAAKSGLPSQTGMGHNSSVGSRGSSGAIVHYICTGASAPAPTLQGMMLNGQRAVQQPKTHSSKVTSTSQSSFVLPQNSVSPSSTSNTPPVAAVSQPK